MSVSTRLKRIAAGALVVPVVIGGALVALPQFITEDETREAVARSLLSVTGIQPQIAETRLVLLPRPAVRMEDVRIDDGINPVFSAKALQATLRILPLLRGHAEIAALTFEQPRLSVKTRDDGVLTVGLPLRTDITADAIPFRPEIRFLNGSVLVHIPDSETTETISPVDAALVWSGSGLTATGSFHWRTIPTSVSLSIGDLAAFVRGDRSGLRLRLDSEPMRIGFDGSILYLNGLQADGTISADARSLRNVIALLPAGPLTRDGFGPFQLKAQATLTPLSLALNELTVELDGNRAEGGLIVKRDGERVLVQATLASETADFTPYSGGFAMTSDNGRDWNRTPIELDALDTFDLDLRLSSRRVVVRKTEFRRVAATAALRNGQFTLSVGEAEFYGGALRGRASIGRSSNGDPAVKIEANISDFDLRRGLPGISGMHRLEGKGTLALAIEGAGRHVQGIARDLSGSAVLTAAPGMLHGINVEQVLRRLERSPLSGFADFVGGRTAFDRLTVKLGIAEGTARIEEAEAESPLVRVSLGGEASVGRRNYDLTGTASLLRPDAAADAPKPFELPFLVRGSWERPFLLPDPMALIQRSGAAAPLLDAVRRQQAARERAEARERADETRR